MDLEHPFPLGLRCCLDDTAPRKRPLGTPSSLSGSPICTHSTPASLPSALHLSTAQRAAHLSAHLHGRPTSLILCPAGTQVLAERVGTWVTALLFPVPWAGRHEASRLSPKQTTAQDPGLSHPAHARGQRFMWLEERALGPQTTKLTCPDHSQSIQSMTSDTSETVCPAASAMKGSDQVNKAHPISHHPLLPIPGPDPSSFLPYMGT